jgi:hypothetical protein
VTAAFPPMFIQVPFPRTFPPAQNVFVTAFIVRAVFAPKAYSKHRSPSDAWI